MLWTTCGDAPTVDCVDTLQDAVDLAANGDTIALAEGWYDEAVVVSGKDLTLTAADPISKDLPVLGGSDTTDEEPALLVVGGTVKISSVLIVTATARPLVVEDADVTIDSAYLRAASWQEEGGLVLATGGSLTITGSWLDGGGATGAGGQIAAVDTDLVLQTSTFSDGTSLGGGGAVDVRGVERRVSVGVDGCLFRGAAGLSGGALYTDHATLGVIATTFEGNSARKNGGAVLAYDTRGVVLESAFSDNASAGSGGAVAFWEPLGGDVPRLARDLFCANGAGDEGGAIWTTGGDGEMTNLLVMENTAGTNGGGLALSSGTYTVGHGTWLGNAASAKGGAVYAEEGASLALGDDVFAGNDAIALTLYTKAATTTSASDLFWEDEGGDADGYTTVTAPVVGDPRLDGWVADGRCDWTEARTSWYGAGRDQGQLGPDPDGSPSDLGALGGPDASDAAWYDGDTDGSPALYDCDDHDATIAPNLDEVWYDGIDEDCDGADDDDQDADGQDAAAQGGTDCDDTDPAVYLGAVDVAYDGVDQNCDGSDRTDVDGDGYPSDGVDGGTDCDDTDPQVHPNQVDKDPNRDIDCDGYVDVVSPLVPRRCDTTGGAGELAALVALAAVLSRRRR